MTLPRHIPGIGDIQSDCGFVARRESSNGLFQAGTTGVDSIVSTGDGKVELISFARHTIAFVNSALGYPAYYPVHPVKLTPPVRAVLMDLDGTSVRSEEFWIWIIQRTMARLLGDPGFELEEADLPYVSGHSVSEHLKHCLAKYAPEKSVEEARRCYFAETGEHMKAILEGRGKENAFSPAPGLKEMLLELKSTGMKIGLVTSGLYEKAWPEIVSAFRTMGMGDPRDFYDAIISAGFPLRKGEAGTLGELSPKPHPWLYAETCRVGLGVPFEQRNSVIGVEDSGAGVCAIRLAGFPTVGIAGGNITESGTRGMCSYYCEDLTRVLDLIRAVNA